MNKGATNYNKSNETNTKFVPVPRTGATSNSLSPTSNELPRRLLDTNPIHENTKITCLASSINQHLLHILLSEVEGRDRRRHQGKTRRLPPDTHSSVAMEGIGDSTGGSQGEGEVGGSSERAAVEGGE